jgi:hypothetical protein
MTEPTKTMETENLHLQYMFTDRGGSLVYTAFYEDDRNQRMHPRFQIRIHPDNVVMLPDPPDPALEDDDDD